MNHLKTYSQHVNESASLKKAVVKFEDPKYNYTTSVNGRLSDEEIKSYFIGTTFNVGVYPEENMQTCIDCEVEESDI